MQLWQDTVNQIESVLLVYWSVKTTINGQAVWQANGAVCVSFESGMQNEWVVAGRWLWVLLGKGTASWRPESSWRISPSMTWPSQRTVDGWHTIAVGRTYRRGWALWGIREDYWWSWTMPTAKSRTTSPCGAQPWTLVANEITYMLHMFIHIPHWAHALCGHCVTLIWGTKTRLRNFK